MLNIYEVRIQNNVVRYQKACQNSLPPFDLMLTLILIIYIDYKPRILIARVGEHAWIGRQARLAAR